MTTRPYAEMINGATLMRRAPGVRHELICERLHHYVRASVADQAGMLLLAPRSEVRLAQSIAVCPDLSLVNSANGRLWLAAEIVSSDDHRIDTVIKKQLYEELRLPRLWMIDPRYDNVEIYHGTEHGMMLKAILAGKESLTDKLLPEFEIGIAELFAPVSQRTP